MVDIENDIFDEVVMLLEGKYSNIYVTGEEITIPSKFPCVSIIEADNYTEDSTLDSSGQENHANVMFEVNIYSNKKTGKKAEAKAILEDTDKVLFRLGFKRINKTSMTMTHYRIVARYTAQVSKNKEIFRR